MLDGFLLKENGGLILKEDGGGILLEDTPTHGSFGTTVQAHQVMTMPAFGKNGYVKTRSKTVYY